MKIRVDGKEYTEEEIREKIEELRKNAQPLYERMKITDDELERMVESTKHLKDIIVPTVTKMTKEEYEELQREFRQ